MSDESVIRHHYNLFFPPLAAFRVFSLGLPWLPSGKTPHPHRRARGSDQIPQATQSSWKKTKDVFLAFWFSEFDYSEPCPGPLWVFPVCDPLSFWNLLLGLESFRALFCWSFVSPTPASPLLPRPQRGNVGSGAHRSRWLHARPFCFLSAFQNRRHWLLCHQKEGETQGDEVTWRHGLDEKVRSTIHDGCTRQVTLKDGAQCKLGVVRSGDGPGEGGTAAKRRAEQRRAPATSSRQGTWAGSEDPSQRRVCRQITRVTKPHSKNKHTCVHACTCV